LFNYSRQVLDDYSFAKKKYKDDVQLSVIGSALDLSQEALIYDPLQLTPQLLDRLAGEEVRFIINEIHEL